MKLIRVIFLTFVLVLSLNAKQKVNVNFSDLEIKDFIRLVAKITNKSKVVEIVDTTCCSIPSTILKKPLYWNVNISCPTAISAKG